MSSSATSSRRQWLTLTGGPLDGCTVSVTGPTAATGTVLVHQGHGRYVHLDADQWAWEVDTPIRSRPSAPRAP